MKAAQNAGLFEFRDGLRRTGRAPEDIGGSQRKGGHITDIQVYAFYEADRIILFFTERIQLPVYHDSQKRSGLHSCLAEQSFLSTAVFFKNTANEIKSAETEENLLVQQ